MQVDDVEMEQKSIISGPPPTAGNPRPPNPNDDYYYATYYGEGSFGPEAAATKKKTDPTAGDLGARYDPERPLNGQETGSKIRVKSRMQAEQVGLSMLGLGAKLLPHGTENGVGLRRIDGWAAGVLLDYVRAPARNPGDPASVAHYTARHATILRIAKLVHGAKVGNCSELASLVYAALFVRGFHPIRWVHFPLELGDHCFIIVGDDEAATVIDLWAYLGVFARDPALSDIAVYPVSLLQPRLAELYRRLGEPRGPDLRDLREVYRHDTGGSVTEYVRITDDQEAADFMDLSDE